MDKEDSNEYARTAFSAFMNNIGGTSEMVCRSMIKLLDMEEALEETKKRFEVKEAWEALYKLRKEVYYKEFATEVNVLKQKYNHNLGNLLKTYSKGVPIGVATSSRTADAERVLKILGVRDCIKVLNGADKVEKPKPNPDIYLKTAKELGVDPNQVLVFEDSLNGIKAAVKAGTNVIAVANMFTKAQLKEQKVLSQDQIVYDVKDLPSMIEKTIESMKSREKK